MSSKPFSQTNSTIDRERAKFIGDLDDNTSVNVVAGKQLSNHYGMIEQVAIDDNREFDTWFAENNPLVDYETYRFFFQGSEQFAIGLGQDANDNIGAIKAEPALTIQSVIFAQGVNLGNRPTGSTMGFLYAIGGGNVVFSILQDLSGLFEISGNTLISKAPIQEGEYPLVVKATGVTSQFIEQITVIVRSTALITNINLTEVSVNEDSPIGTTVGAFSTQGGEPPIAYSILSQSLDNVLVDVFEIQDDFLVTKDVIAPIGSQYTIFIQAEDSRSELPDDQRIRTEEFTIEVVAQSFVNTFSFSFNGVDEKIEIPSSPTLNIPNDITLGCWVKTGHNDNQSFMAKWLSTNNQRQYFLGMLPTGEFRVLLSGDGLSSGGQFKQYNTVDLINDNQWHHLAFTFSTNVLKLYIDGTERTVVKVVDETINNLFTGTGDFNISSFDNSSSFYANGLIDEPAIWNRELTAQEIQDVYNNGVTRNLLALSTAANLSMWLRMGDFLNGVIEPDQTTNGNDGTIINMNNSNRSTDIPT